MEVVEKTIRNTPNLHKLLTIRSVTNAEQEIQIIVFRFCRQKLHVSYKFFGVRSKNFFALSRFEQPADAARCATGGVVEMIPALELKSGGDAERLTVGGKIFCSCLHVAHEWMAGLALFVADGEIDTLRLGAHRMILSEIQKIRIPQ